MKKYFRIRIYFFLLPLYSITPCQAEHNTSIDVIHNFLSEKVVVWSSKLDTSISQWLGDSNNTSCVAPRINENLGLNHDIKNIDTFFQNNKYLNDTRDIYIRLRLNSDFHSRKSNKNKIKFSAQIPFDKCKQQLKLFFQDPSLNNGIKSTDSSNNGIGIRYNRKEDYGFDSSYSIGFSEHSPYLRARYTFPLETNGWKIEPIQTFKYSHKHYFEEESNIYFDKYYNHNTLFRIQLHKKSASNLLGTNYGITFQHYLNLGKDAGVEFTQSFFGNTHYNHLYSSDKDYHHINNYVTSFSWRENIWRKWLYYEIRPTLNFHKDNAYKPSYALQFTLDFYFGDFH